MPNKLDYVKTRREDVDEIPLKWQRLIQRVMKHYTRFNVWVYKKSGGRLLKNFPVWLRIDVEARFINAARIMLVLGCYANIIGPIINALFIAKRLIVPETPLEAFVVYGFYIPGTLPIFSFAIFMFNLFGHQKNKT